MIHPIECDPSQLPLDHLYVFNAVPGSNDPRWSTLGTTYLATVGQQAAATLGELWVSFDVEFYMPKLISSVSSNGLGSHYFTNTGLLPNAFSTTSVFPANFPSAATLIAGDLPMTPYLNSFQQIVGLSFPPGLTGTYQVQVVLYAGQTITGTPTPATPVFPGTFINCVQALIYGAVSDGSHYQASEAPGFSAGGTLSFGDAYIFTYAVTLKPTSPTTVSSINLGTLFSGGFTGTALIPLGIDVFVVALPYNI